MRLAGDRAHTLGPRLVYGRIPTVNRTIDAPRVRVPTTPKEFST